MSAEKSAAAERVLSYGQRYEDLYLLRCFEGQPSGFYVDIGAGHPIVDNVSFAFYLKGWHGLLVEPNPDLARLTRAVRPRDTVHEGLVGASAGHALFHRIENFHGLSTTIPALADKAAREFGKPAEPMELPVTTLAALSAAHAGEPIDFLKIDVEGAEQAVLEGADFIRFRPKVVLVEALAPYTLAPSWAGWEPLLTSRDYRYAFFDGLNRYYVATEAQDLTDRFPADPLRGDGIVQFGVLPPALEAEEHPDGGLAALLATSLFAQLPLLDRTVLLQLVTADLTAEHLGRPVTEEEVAAAWVRLLGGTFPVPTLRDLGLPADARVRDLYRILVNGDAFRVVCGRIAASYAW